MLMRHLSTLVAEKLRSIYANALGLLVRYSTGEHTMSAKAAFIDAAAVCLRVGREAGDRMRQELLTGSIEQATKIQGEQSGAIACAEELIRLAGQMRSDDTLDTVREIVDVRLGK